MLKNIKIQLLSITVVITMLSITQLFASSKDNNESTYMPRQINLSGNIINFSIPENFSKDMPADDLVEKLDLNDKNLFNKTNSVALLRRWWDFKDDSFFSKNVGSMMMTIHVYKVKKSDEDISHPIGFINVLFEEMERRDKEENIGRDESTKVYFPEHYQSFFEKIINNQKWIRGGSSDANELQKAFHEWKQITPKHFIGVEFHFAPNNSIGMRPFLDTYCRDMLEKIMSTFDVIYSNDNPIKAKLEKNSQLNLEKLIKKMD